MKTKDVLSVMMPGTVVNIYQVPIERFDKSGAEVCRQVGEITALLSSGQNYLEFDVVRIEQRAELMTIVCKADAAQEAATVAAFYGTEENLDIRDLIQDETPIFHRRYIMSVCEMCQYGGDNRRKMTAAEIYSMYIKFGGNDPCWNCVHNPGFDDNFSPAKQPKA